MKGTDGRLNAESILSSIYAALRAEFGPRNWWPADTPFEVMVGAVLTQNTNWGNVERAIGNLKRAGMLGPAALAAAGADELQALIRPAGYYRQKAARLKRLVEWLMSAAGGEVSGLRGRSTEELREQLLSLSGIGPETADSILLYALDRMTFVVDAYTKRALVRHQMVGPECSYYELQEFVCDGLPQDLELYRDYHAQFVELGKRLCRKKPLCDRCPLLPLLGSPVLEEGI